MAAEKTPIDPQRAAVDLLRLERIEAGLLRDIESLRDRHMTFPSVLTERQLERVTAEHQTVVELIEELRSCLGLETTLPD
jgi:hypothetical protein